MKIFTKIKKLFRMNSSPFRAAVKPLFFAFLAGNLFFLNCGNSTEDEGGAAAGPTTFSAAASVESITIDTDSRKSFKVNLSKTGPGQIGSATLSFTKTTQNSALGNSITLPGVITITEGNLSEMHTAAVMHTGDTTGKLTINIALLITLAGDSTPLEYADSVEVTVVDTTFSTEASVKSIAVDTGTSNFTVALSKLSGSRGIGSAALSFTKTTNPQNQVLEDSITLPQPITITNSNLGDMHAVTVMHTGATTGVVTVNITLSVTLAGESTSVEYTDSVEVTVEATTFRAEALVENITVQTGSSGSFTVDLSKMGPRGIGSAALSFTKTTNPQNQVLENSITLPQEMTITDSNLNGPHTVIIAHTGTETGVLTVDITFSVTLAGESTSVEYTDSVEVTVVDTTFSTEALVESITVDSGSSNFTVTLSKVSGSKSIGSAALSFTKATNPQNQDLENSITLPSDITITESNLGDMHDVTIMHTGTASGVLTVNIIFSVTLTGESTSAKYTDSVEVTVVATTFSTEASLENITVQTGSSGSFAVALSKVSGSRGIGSAALSFTKTPDNSNLANSITLPNDITVTDSNLSDMHDVTIMHTGTRSGVLTVNITFSVTLTGESTPVEYTDSVEVTVEATTFITEASVENIAVQTGTSGGFAVTLTKVSGSKQIASAVLSFTKTPDNSNLANSITLPQPITITNSNLSADHAVTITHSGTTSGDLTVNIIFSVTLTGESTPVEYTDSVEITAAATTFSTAASLESITVYIGSSRDFTVELSKISGSKQIESGTLSFSKTSQDQTLADSITLPGTITITESNLSDMHAVTVAHTGTLTGDLRVNITFSVTLAGETILSEYTDTVQITVHDAPPGNILLDSTSISFPFVEIDSNTVLNKREQRSYQVKFDKIPTGNVTVEANAPAGVTVLPPTLTFTPTDWDTYQTFTVTAADSVANAGNLEITHMATADSAEEFTRGTHMDIGVRVIKTLFDPVDPINYVDTLIATGTTISPSNPGNTLQGNKRTNNYVGAHYPFGMSLFTPMNAINAYRDGDATYGGADRWTNYADKQHRIKGFALTDIPGPGCDLGGEFPLMLHLGDKDDKSLYSIDKSNVPVDTLLPLYIKGNEPADNVKGKRGDVRGDYTRSDVKGEAGYYEVTFSNELKARLTVGQRTGMAEFHLPNTADAAKATLFFTTASRMSRFETSLEKGRSTTGLAKSVRGMIYSKGFCWDDKSAHRIYMVGVFQQQPISLEPTILTQGSKNLNNFRSSGGNHYIQAAYVFNKPDSGKIRVKYGLSYVSHAGAWENLKAEMPAWRFTDLKNKAQAAWRNILNKVKVQVPNRAARKDDLTIFYSAAYRALSSPHTFSDADGRYIGFNNTIYHTELLAGGRRRIQYQYYSGWDTYRSQMQMVSLFSREISGDMMQSLINNANQANCQSGSDAGVRGVASGDGPTPEFPNYGGCDGGGFTRWGVANDDSNIMDGQPGAIMVANALAVGVTDFNADSAYDVMVRSSSPIQTSNIRSGKGDSGTYTFLDINGEKTRSNSLELASAYFSKAVFARRLAKFKTDSVFADKYSFNADRLAKAESDYEDQSSTFFIDNVKHFRIYQGDGGLADFEAPTDGTTTVSRAYQEGDVRQYTWMYPMNMAGSTQSPLTRVFGWDGADGTLAAAVTRAVNQLNTHLSDVNGGQVSAFVWMGNEPSHVAPFSYLFLDAANVYKSQEVVRRVQKQLYKNSVQLGLAGNDDLGAMSSWYVWTAIGLYPAVPGMGHYSIVTPLFDQILIDKDDGRGGVILMQASNSSPSVSGSDDYIQFIKDVKLNGLEHNKAYFHFLELYQNTKNSIVDFDLTQALPASDAESSVIQSQVKKDWEIAPSFTAIDQVDSHL